MEASHASTAPRRTRAVLAILLVTFFWGWTFIWMKQAVNASGRILGPSGSTAGVGLFMSARFGLAALLLALWPAARRGLDRGAWHAGLLLGALLLAGFLFQMVGLEGVSPAVSAFLTSLYVIFTAALLWARTRRPVGGWLALGALLSTFGAGFIGGPPHLSFGRDEWLTVGCAFLFALHILYTDVLTRRHAPLAITLTSFLVVFAGSVATTALGSQLEGGPTWAALIELMSASDFALPLVLSSVLATAVAITLMNLFQRELDPVRAAILYAVEPVWAALISLSMGLALADRWLWIGGGALLAGNLVAELGPLAGQRRKVLAAPAGADAMERAP
jgi:drug/metabolite transporter (DMT)-like permease